jgi:hypothetical protein
VHRIGRFIGAPAHQLELHELARFLAGALVSQISGVWILSSPLWLRNFSNLFSPLWHRSFSISIERSSFPNFDPHSSFSDIPLEVSQSVYHHFGAKF